MMCQNGEIKGRATKDPETAIKKNGEIRFRWTWYEQRRVGADLHFSFWDFSNRIPSISVDKTPYEICNMKRHSFVFFKITCHEAFVKRLQSDNFIPKSDKCIFVRYLRETLDYCFYNRVEGKVFVARNDIFQEKKFSAGRTMVVQ